MEKKIDISIVIPVYGCIECLDELVRRLKKTLNQISEKYEIILVNDASPDGAWHKITELYLNDNNSSLMLGKMS